MYVHQIHIFHLYCKVRNGNFSQEEKQQLNEIISIIFIFTNFKLSNYTYSRKFTILLLWSTTAYSVGKDLGQTSQIHTCFQGENFMIDFPKPNHSGSQVKVSEDDFQFLNISEKHFYIWDWLAMHLYLHKFKECRNWRIFSPNLSFHR